MSVELRYALKALAVGGAVGLYAPQDPEELAGAAEALSTGAQLLLDELPADGAAVDPRLAAAAGQVAEVHGRLLDRLRALAEDAQAQSSHRPEE